MRGASQAARTPQPSADRPALDRRLGPFDAAAIVISNVISSGIFFVPVIVAQLVPHPGAIIGVWLAGGALAFAGAMAYAELAALKPHAGGEYVYLREAFGPLAAFLSGWTSFVAGFSGAIAAGSIAMADYIGRFIPAAADTTPIVGIAALSISRRSLVALTPIVVLTMIHVRGLGPGRLLQNVLAGLKVSAIVVFVALGFAIGHGSVSHLTADASAAPVSMLLALVPVMFSYSGWNAAAYVAEEIRNPARNVPLALALGTVTVVVLYVALNVLYLYAMSTADLAALPGGRLIDSVAERLFGFVAGNVLAVFTIVSLAASISAMVLAGPRVYYAMARDGLFVQMAERVHPRFHTPAAAIVAQGIWSGVLVLSGTLSQLVSYTGFAVVLFAGIAVLALFVLRHRDGRARPFAALGYPWAPAIFVIASVAMVGNELWRNAATTLAGLAIIAAGIPAYFAMRRAPTVSAAPGGRR
jgi:APA family basic amino acid/polyamine antiporter